MGPWERLTSHVCPLSTKLLYVLYPLLILSTHGSSLDHFHVHIVNVNYDGLLGMSVGQAHLLDDIISLVRRS